VLQLLPAAGALPPVAARLVPEALPAAAAVGPDQLTASRELPEPEPGAPEPLTFKGAAPLTVPLTTCGAFADPVVLDPLTPNGPEPLAPSGALADPVVLEPLIASGPEPLAPNRPEALAPNGCEPLAPKRPEPLAPNGPELLTPIGLLGAGVESVVSPVGVV
jgi:hypothetical protein